MLSRLDQVDWSKWDSKEDNFAKYSCVKSELIYGKLPEKKPDISIMIPTFRRADLLQEAIDSALAQKTQYIFTITVVDNDADVDWDTDNLMKRYCAEHENVMYYRNAENIGMFGNWNRCIELSQTEWLCLLHDDDMLMDNYIQTFLSINLPLDTGIMISLSKMINTTEDSKLSFPERIYGLIGKMIKHPKIRPWRWELGNMFNPTCMLLNRELCVNVGGLDDRFYPISDGAFAMKMSYYHKTYFFNMQLSIRRNENNESLNLNTQKEILKNTFRTSIEYFKKLQYNEAKAQKEAAAIIVGMFCNYNCISIPEMQLFLKELLKTKKIYSNIFCQKIYHVWYLWRKFLKTV